MFGSQNIGRIFLRCREVCVSVACTSVQFTVCEKDEADTSGRNLLTSVHKVAL